MITRMYSILSMRSGIDLIIISQEEKLVIALDEVLHNPKYTRAAQKFGSLLNDQITKPLDRAVWWIEHIMRHPDMYAGKSPVTNYIGINISFWMSWLLD